jgi:hypothetical protein
MSQDISYAVVEDDITRFTADVVALKFAQGLHGADAAVARKLGLAEGVLAKQLAGSDGYYLAGGQGRIGADQVLFISAPSLFRFRYGEIRHFAQQVLAVLQKAAPSTRQLAVTIHGVNYGLDEAEAFAAQMNGFLDGLRTHRPPRLERITFVEHDRRRVQRLQAALRQFFTGGDEKERPGSVTVRRGAEPGQDRQSAGKASEAKPHVFVAMPFTPEFEDVYYYGIERPVKDAGYLCERIDLTSFSGDVVNQIKQRIDTAALVIADLSAANPNVYLEVGYAWGRARPTVLLVRAAEELKFDVKTQRCLVYGKSIKKLEESLTKELATLPRKP